MAQQQPQRDPRRKNEQEYTEQWRDDFGRPAATDPAAPYAYYGSAAGGGAAPPPPAAVMTTATDYGAATETGTGLYPSTAAAAPYGMDPTAAGTGAAYGTGAVGAGSQWGRDTTARGGGDLGAGNRNKDDLNMNMGRRNQK